ncbi:hypothetical protein FisN_20Lh072 [Fistulifera solaris]|uniref:Uncharacterized protein n=1 Tax=Fistulifera solaris TaxID=1519565 RepID=A0A1Z5JDN0_FISSO|nr:hypothetical protein FisN_20Lh072 [Fistulifera solaris]|eukprot:GAX11871.1 hypothetical protein FisN_20Lh072 [Fistulifera solaris]
MPTDDDDDENDGWPRKPPCNISFFCPCWGTSIDNNNKSRHVRFAEPITMSEEDDDDDSCDKMIPSIYDDDDDDEAEFLFQESYQTNAELFASLEHDYSMLDRILGPFRAKSQKQIIVLEEIIRLFLFVILLRWKEEPERLSALQQSNETTKTTKNKDPVNHTTTPTNSTL